MNHRRLKDLETIQAHLWIWVNPGTLRMRGKTQCFLRVHTWTELEEIAPEGKTIGSLKVRSVKGSSRVSWAKELVWGLK